MPLREPEGTIRQTVLDRLVGGGTADSASPSWGESVAELKRSLLRDLDWLLNTRRIAFPAPDEFPEVQRSVYHYGLPDVTSLSGDSGAVRRRLMRQIEEAIQLFEPRLTNVRVSTVDGSGMAGRQIRFVIEALLRLDPTPERVVFDTVLETASGKILIGSDDDG